MNHRHTPDLGLTVALDATPKPRHMGGLRQAIYYRVDGAHFQRCSRCHSETELPVLYDAQGKQPPPTGALASIMLGNTLMGFLCSDCFLPTAKLIATSFPLNNPFPLVDHHGRLAPPPRCDECSEPLCYDPSGDGRKVICSRCDGSKA